MMRAVVFDRYGDPKEVMKVVAEKKIPQPKSNDVLVKIECSSINAADMHMVLGDYLIVRIVLGLFRPAKKNRILGMDVAGTIQSVGKNVQGFKVGDEVAADIRKSFGGGFAEYAVVKAVDLVKKPTEVSFDQAATVPISGQAAMMGVLLCSIKPGDKILIRGASGGVGSFAVQIAKALGAHVTAICSVSKAPTVESWGADETVDYEQTSIGDLAEKKYDAVLDTASFGCVGQFGAILKNDGRYVLVGGSYYNMLLVKLFGKRYARSAQIFKSLTQESKVTDNIKKVFAMIANGDVVPAIQKTISLAEIPSAINNLENRSVIGKIVSNNRI